MSREYEADARTGIVLVDTTAKNRFTSQEKQMILQSQPFQGGYEDFLERSSFFDNDMSCPGRSSLLEDLVYYWRKERPPSFNPRSPTLLSLAYYPLKIVAAEWVSYVAVMSNSIKQYEYSTDGPVGTEGLTKLDSDLRSLEAWGRRCLQTSYKLHAVINFLIHRVSKAPDLEQYSLLIEDYEHIAAMVDTYGRRLENMVPVVTSVVQIVDARRSLREAVNVTRLTNLALLFVPLSFVSGLFSMTNGVSAHVWVIYFAVAIPVCAVVFFVARLPLMKIIGLDDNMRKLKKSLRVEV